MAQAATSQSSPAARSFASVLAALALPRQTPHDGRKLRAADNSHRWCEDGLGDDIATISYEQALRTHTRHHSESIAMPTQPENNPLPTSTHNQPLVDLSASSAPSPRTHELSALPALDARRSSSITIRLSKEECDQIHARAAEAQLTVSAYLRSCVLEADQLRAQVKQMLVQIRAVQSAQGPPATSSASRQKSPTWPLSFVRWCLLRRSTQA